VIAARKLRMCYAKPTRAGVCPFEGYITSHRDSQGPPISGHAHHKLACAGRALVKAETGLVNGFAKVLGDATLGIRYIPRRSQHDSRSSVH
jgi:hypothetical protein